MNEVDFFSLDIDSYDYWVFKALEIRPRVVSVEYYAYLGNEPVTAPLNGIPDGAPKYYRGASLSPLDKLAKQKGYSLVGCDYNGVNAFWIRSGLAGDLSPVEPFDVLREPVNRLVAGGVSRDASTRDVLGDLKNQGLILVHV